MKCQILFSRKNKKNITNLSSAESVNSVVSVKDSLFKILADKILFFFFFFSFSEKIRLNISCEIIVLIVKFDLILSSKM